MAGNRPEEAVGLPIAYQRWRHVSFLHWRYDEQVIQRMLPDGLRPDIIDGSAWVGLTPFQVDGFRLPGVPAVPSLSSFPETNLRTYVLDGNGADGLWFFSLDVKNIVMATTARLGLGLRYCAAEMAVCASDVVGYRCRRRWSTASHLIEVQPGLPLHDELSERDAALLGRWRAYSQVASHLVQVPVEHEPWPVHSATVVSLNETITAAAGLPAPEDDPLVHYSPGVNARLGAPRLVWSP